MNALAPAVAARMASIAARLGSPHDGEALNAARLLSRELERAGLRPADVIARGLGPISASAPPPPPLSSMPRHQRTARQALATEYAFAEREIDFLYAMVRAPYCSTTQEAWLNGLLRRASAPPASAPVR